MPAAQRGHRQALSTNAAGTRASASGLIVACVHQHGMSNFPVAAGAHWFPPPQSGQTVFSSG
jgi:hypothetical protein